MVVAAARERGWDEETTLHAFLAGALEWIEDRKKEDPPGPP
jgi:hypothetical protein